MKKSNVILYCSCGLVGAASSTLGLGWNTLNGGLFNLFIIILLNVVHFSALNEKNK